MNRKCDIDDKPNTASNYSTILVLFKLPKHISDFYIEQVSDSNKGKTIRISSRGEDLFGAPLFSVVTKQGYLFAPKRAGKLCVAISY